MSLVKNPGNIRLGIIGMTEGNGHPYSWSAIFNRYDREAMKKECPFPGIPAYLEKEDYDSIGIPGAHVVCVCCDKPEDARHVARLSLVPGAVSAPEDMIGKVDAVIIATDIGSEHVRRAKPFLEAGIPLFIDKPLCDSRADLAWFEEWFRKDYPLMSSSSCRYCKELVPWHGRQCHEIGRLRCVMMTMCKKWETYGIHALEAMYPIVGPGFVSVVDSGEKGRDIVHLKHRDGIDVVIASIRDLKYDPAVTLSGTDGSIRLEPKDSYGSFRAQLCAFIDFLRTGRRPYPWTETVELIRLVSAAVESREQKGKEIFL